MKKIILIFLIINTALQSYSHTEEKLKQAEVFYNQKKYAEALTLYKEAEKEGYFSGDFYYNLGNIYFKSGMLGHAILYYEKALRWIPGNENVKHNLNLCYSRTQDKIEMNENFFIQTLKQGMVYRFSEKSWGYASIGMSLISALLMGLGLLKQGSLRTILIPAALLFLTASFTCYAMGRSIVNENHRPEFAVVLVKEAKVQSEPLQQSFVKFRLHEGAKVKVEEHDSEYTLIRLSNGNEGWILTENLGFI